MSTSNMPTPLTDLELLAIQAEALMDQRGRLTGLCGLMIGTALDGQLMLIGSDIPDALVPALTDALDFCPPAPAVHLEPPALAVCREILQAVCGPMTLHAGPYYTFEREVTVRLDLPIIRSDGAADARLRHLNPGNRDDDEWDALLDGTLGPWAMALVDDRVVSICHTPRPLSARAAEAGVWTHPEYRGRGYAAAVTATWADIVRPSGRYLFYSTDAQNFSSQRVAERLELRQIGWTWNLARATAEPGDSRHPLMRRDSAPGLSTDSADAAQP